MATTKRTKKKPKNRRAAEFWRWFRSGPAGWKDPVREALDNQRMLEIIDAFEARFPEAKHPSYPAGILLEFGEGPRGVCRIVFSLVFNRDDQSRRELAPLIDQIVDAAPKLARWRFQAFADAVSWHDAYLPRLALPGDDIKIDGLSFVVLRAKPLSLRVYAPSYSEDKARAFRIGVERVLETGMGERWVLKRLSSLEVADAAGAPRDARPIRELSER